MIISDIRLTLRISQQKSQVQILARSRAGTQYPKYSRRFKMRPTAPPWQFKQTYLEDNNIIICYKYLHIPSSHSIESGDKVVRNKQQFENKIPLNNLVFVICVQNKRMVSKWIQLFK